MSNTGRADVDLSGTPFAQSADHFQNAATGADTPATTDAWCTTGYYSSGSVTFLDKRHIWLTGSGYCGATNPKSTGATTCANKLVLVYDPT